MKLTRIVRILLLISFLGGSALIYAQDQRDDAKLPEEPRPEVTKPAGNDVKIPRQDETKPSNRMRPSLQNRMTSSLPGKRASPQIRNLSRQTALNTRRRMLSRAAAFLTTSFGLTSDGSILLSSSNQP